MELTLDKLVSTKKLPGFRPKITVKLPDGTKLELDISKINQSRKKIDEKIAEYQDNIDSSRAQVNALTVQIEDEQASETPNESVIQNLSDQISALGTQIESDSNLLQKFQRVKSKLKKLYALYITKAAKAALTATGVGAPFAYLLDFLPDSAKVWIADHIYFLLIIICLPCFCVIMFIWQLQLAGGDPTKIAAVFDQTGCDKTQLIGIGMGIQSTGQADTEAIRNLDCNFKKYTDESVCGRTATKTPNCQ